MKRVSIFIVSLISCLNLVAAAGSYAPAAGQPGSTAIILPDDPNDPNGVSVFAGWADGWCDYMVGEEVDGNWMVPDRALGVAAGTSYDIVSLGRGGEITLTFSTPITDGPGWDFATFENGVMDTFLELGYVEVSSDGDHFVRFDNYSQTPDPVGAFGAIDPENITGYCSKYKQGCGTPFDLNDLVGIEGIDLRAVTHVRIVDIVGDGTYTDTAGNPIYDPYPTIGSAGVDLDAIGVMNQCVLSADFNDDKVINFLDFAVFAKAYASDDTMENWNLTCDIEQTPDGTIDADDLIVFAEQWLIRAAITE